MVRRRRSRKNRVPQTVHNDFTGGEDSLFNVVASLKKFLVGIQDHELSKLTDVATVGNLLSGFDNFHTDFLSELIDKAVVNVDDKVNADNIARLINQCDMLMSGFKSEK